MPWNRLRKLALLPLACAASGLVAAALAQTASHASPAGSPGPVPVESRPPAGAVDEIGPAIRASAAAFTAAYNAHDASAVAELFVPQGEFVELDGVVVVGRAEIERQMGRFFADYPTVHLAIEIEAIRQPTPGVVVEDGVNRVVLAAGERPVVTRYSVVHVRCDGTWLIASSREFAENTAEGVHPLKELEYLVGEWVAERPEALVETSTQWADDRNFLIQQFAVRVAGEVVLHGTTRIAWDPAARRFRSWTFDSTGGFGEGHWERDGHDWVIHSQFVDHDGQALSAETRLAAPDHDTLVLVPSVMHAGADAPLVPAAEIVMKRRPPPPQSGGELREAASPVSGGGDGKQ